MYVCLCNAVNDRQVKQALADGKQDLRELRRHLGFQRCCGHCTAYLRDMICEHRREAARQACARTACAAQEAV